jgi:chromate reductase
MTRLIGISGSLRKASYNSGLLRAAVEVMPEGVTMEIVSIAGIPLYNGDVEAADGLPEDVVRLKAAIAGADGVLLVTPEYNNGIPGVFKNAIDWASRPALGARSDIATVFGGRPFAVIGASPGGFGTILAQDAWLAVLRTLGTRFWAGGRLMVPGAGDAFDGDGNLVDEAVRRRLARFVGDFAASVG